MKKQIEFFYKKAIETEENTVFFSEKDSRNNPHTIEGNFNVFGGNFLRFSKTFIEQGTFNPDSTLTYQDDGIALETNSKTLILVEIKTTIGFQTYQKILKQLCASYLKTLLKLSLIESPQHIDIQFFIIGNWHKKDIEEETLALDEPNEQEQIYLSFWKLKRNGVVVFPQFPHFAYLSNNLAPAYKKEKVKIWYYPPNSTHNIRENR